MNVLHLLRVTRQKVKVDLLAECQNQKRQDERKSKKEHLTFDPSYFRAATTTYGGLSTSARTALWKPIGHRTPDDVRILTVRFRLAIFSNMDKVYYNLFFKMTFLNDMQISLINVIRKISSIFFLPLH